MATTIVAVSSGRPPAGIAVIRLSGPEAIAAARAVAGTLPDPRSARVRRLRDAGDATLDRAIVLVFPGPRSATGEDLVEFHCHGGRAVVDAVERALLARPGVRRAEAGEFTRRALTNGRIDLSEAQGLADLLTAETERQRVAAMAAADGRLSRAVRDWMQQLSGIAARVEAMLDFSDEDDVGEADVAEIHRAMLAVKGTIDSALAVPPVERLRDGIRVVLAGPPNAGKSTLVNLMADRDVAIVTPIAGTTRDRIEVPVTRDGIAFVLIDTAGLTESDDAVERIGVARAGEAIATADVLLWLGEETPPAGAIWLWSRADERGEAPQHRTAVSRETPASVDRLWDMIVARAETMIPRADDVTLDRRQRDACGVAAGALSHPGDDPLILAEQLRAANNALATILGIDATEAMLDSLFGAFCIGK